MDNLLRKALLLILLSTITAAAAAASRITVVGLFKDTAVIMIDGQRRLLHSGDTSPEGVTLISATSKEAVLEVDGEQKIYGLGGQIGANYTQPEQPTVRIWPTANRMYLVVGSINGYPMNFIVDTGATLVAMSDREARRLGIDYRALGTPGMASTASGLDKIYVLSMDRVKIGEIELRNVQAAIHEGEFAPATLLGMSFLSRLNMRQDGQVLELTKKF